MVRHATSWQAICINLFTMFHPLKKTLSTISMRSNESFNNSFLVILEVSNWCMFMPYIYTSSVLPYPCLKRLGMNRLAIVADSPPWDLSGKWRLDCGANKTAYERRPVGPLDKLVHTVVDQGEKLVLILQHSCSLEPLISNHVFQVSTKQNNS